MTDPRHTTRCTLGPPHPRTGDVPVYGPDGVDGPTLGVVVATNPRAAGDARLWAGAWRMRAALEWIATENMLDPERLVAEMRRIADEALAGRDP
jgi:hypothetical protein